MLLSVPSELEEADSIVFENRRVAVKAYRYKKVFKNTILLTNHPVNLKQNMLFRFTSGKETRRPEMLLAH